LSFQKTVHGTVVTVANAVTAPAYGDDGADILSQNLFVVQHFTVMTVTGWLLSNREWPGVLEKPLSMKQKDPSVVFDRDYSTNAALLVVEFLETVGPSCVRVVTGTFTNGRPNRHLILSLFFRRRRGMNSLTRRSLTVRYGYL